MGRCLGEMRGQHARHASGPSRKPPDLHQSFVSCADYSWTFYIGRVRAPTTRSGTPMAVVADRKQEIDCVRSVGRSIRSPAALALIGHRRRHGAGLGHATFACRRAPPQPAPVRQSLQRICRSPTITRFAVDPGAARASGLRPSQPNPPTSSQRIGRRHSPAAPALSPMIADARAQSTAR